MKRKVTEEILDPTLQYILINEKKKPFSSKLTSLPGLVNDDLVELFERFG